MKTIASLVALAFASVVALADTPEAFAIEHEAAAKAAPAKAKSKRVKKDGTAQTTWTGPNGRTSTATTTRVGGDSTTTYTGPNGQTATRTTTFTPK